MWVIIVSTLPFSEPIICHTKADIENCLLVFPSSFHVIQEALRHSYSSDVPELEMSFLLRAGGRKVLMPTARCVEAPERGRKVVPHCQILRRKKWF